MRSMITSFPFEGRTLIRAHVWNAKGYSTRTFNTAGEAQAWIAGKRAA